MPVSSIGAYKFPSRSRQELYGDDLMVHVWWRNNNWHCAANAIRVPSTMTWSEMIDGIVTPWAACDPDFDPANYGGWVIDGRSVRPDPDQTLSELGIRHKSLVEFTA